MDKADLIKAIEEMIIYEKDYETLLQMMHNMDDRFFVKVIEEIILGNLYISDFERIFSDDSYSTMLRLNLENQEKMYNELLRLVQYRKDILGENYSISPSNMIALVKPTTGNSYELFYDTLSTELTRECIYQMLKSLPNDNDIVSAAKLKIFKAIENGLISKEDLLLFSNSKIIPIDFQYQSLTESDMNFMIENNLSSDEIKKIKALSIFLRRKHFEEDL